MTEGLRQRLIEVQQHNSQTDEGQQAIALLAEEILRSRTICRPLKGYSLSVAQRVIYEHLKTQLLAELPVALKTYDPQKISLKDWASDRWRQGARQGLEDNLLKQLAIEIQQQSNLELKRHLLGELVEAIRLSGKLCRPHREKFSPEFYDLIYEEATIRTFAYICKNIHQYDPERGQNQKFMNWVNFRLDRLVIECRREFNEATLEELPSLADLENLPQPDSESLLEETINYIKSDPQKCFQQEFIRNRPDATFQAIALARLSGKSWEEISDNFNIKVPTLSSFFQRCCSKFREQFQRDLTPD